MSVRFGGLLGPNTAPCVFRAAHISLRASLHYVAHMCIPNASAGSSIVPLPLFLVHPSLFLVHLPCKFILCDRRDADRTQIPYLTHVAVEFIHVNRPHLRRPYIACEGVFRETMSVKVMQVKRNPVRLRICRGRSM